MFIIISKFWSLLDPSFDLTINKTHIFQCQKCFSLTSEALFQNVFFYDAMNFILYILKHSKMSPWFH